MIKQISLIALLFISCFAYSNDDLKALRELYYASVESSSKADGFYKKMNASNSTSGITIAYKAMSNMLVAKHSWNPYSKFYYFNTGKELLEKSVSLSSNNVEIRFLRYCIQANAPFFLDYHHQTEEDFKIIKENWSTIKDIDLKNRISDYMIQSANLNAEQKLHFKKETK